MTNGEALTVLNSFHKIDPLPEFRLKDYGLAGEVNFFFAKLFRSKLMEKLFEAPAR